MVYDVGRTWRREATLSLHPDTSADLVQPRGYLLRLTREISVAGRAWIAPLGVYRLTGYERDDSGVWRVSGVSSEYEVARAEYLRPRRLDGASVASVIAAQIREAVPDALVSITASTDMDMTPLVVERDRWKAIDGDSTSMARMISAEVYCDLHGGFLVADVPLGTVPDWTATDAVTGWRESSSEDGVYNVVVATGEDTGGKGPLPWGMWWDDNPGSPTYVGDGANTVLSGQVAQSDAADITWAVRGFGVAVYRMSSPLLKTTSACRAAARTRGLSGLGIRRKLSLGMLANPWADVGDLVAVPVAGRMEHHRLDTLTIPVGRSAGPMSAETREVAV